MLKNLLLAFLILTNLALTQGKVKVLLDSLRSNATNSYKKFNIILPKDYEQSEERYPVLYLLHGYAGSHRDWVNKTGLIRYINEYKLIVVTPEADNSWYTNSLLHKDRNYEDYIIKELIPYVEEKYRVISTRHGRAIAGLSMGGYGAVKFGLKYPSYFQLVGSFSGAFNLFELMDKNKYAVAQSLIEVFGEKRNEHWIKNDIFSLVDSLADKTAPYFYISCGFEDEIEGLLHSNREFVKLLQSKKIRYEYHELPGGHNWLFWDKEIENFLKLLNRCEF
ncbi:S-formylglutathione hydrolase FrmB [Candidatus Thermokryptus mobilis]|uniref:S-formylglutathione hydrolase FrmB n=1 Tax=Candidatus Thermokryptus mobilis TaxID=1643428 RepID=A0A0S4NAW1_9BACT|nr:alpha/beta hydrolase family protein [Candidatus Thermokryptus mobilis]CUU08266.1 S-formylglutathione hydrolase FrmB [Candidatus Thermokryptus mobilis]